MEKQERARWAQKHPYNEKFGLIVLRRRVCKNRRAGLILLASKEERGSDREPNGKVKKR